MLQPGLPRGELPVRSTCRQPGVLLFEAGSFSLTVRANDPSIVALLIEKVNKVLDAGKQ